jgi:hypothetical protein
VLKAKGVQMSMIRKLSFAIVVILAIALMGFTAGCEGGSESSQQTKVVLKPYPVKYSILVPDGWTKRDSPGGAAYTKGNNAIEITISENGATEDESKASLANWAKEKGGTPLEEVTMFGVKFFKTSYTEYGCDITGYSRIIYLQQVQINTCDDKENSRHAEIYAEMMAMLESLQFQN